jgi:hypothetical protein
VTPDQQRRFLTAFLAAAQAGEFADLEAMLADDVVSYAIGGGARLSPQGCNGCDLDRCPCG